MIEIKELKTILDGYVKRKELKKDDIPNFLRGLLFDFKISEEQYLILINAFGIKDEANINQIMDREYGNCSIRYKSISDLDKMNYIEMLRYVESKKGVDRDYLLQEAVIKYEQGKLSGGTLNNFASFLDVRLNDAFVEQSINEGRYYRKEIK